VCRPASTHCTHYTSSMQNTQSAPERQQEEPCFRSASRQKRKCGAYRMGKKKMTNSTKMCPYRPARPDVAQHKLKYATAQLSPLSVFMHWHKIYAVVVANRQLYRTGNARGVTWLKISPVRRNLDLTLYKTRTAHATRFNNFDNPKSVHEYTLY
jgi:hypothetical protein